jgi:hypothetical protein
VTDLQGIPTPPVNEPEVIQGEQAEAARATALSAARSATTLAEQTQHVAQLAHLTARLLAGSPAGEAYEGEPLERRARRIALEELEDVFAGVDWPEALESAATEAAYAGLHKPLVEIRADGPVDPAAAVAQRYEDRKLREGVQQRHLRDRIDAAYRAEKFPYAELLGGPSGFACAADDFDAVMSAKQEMLISGWIPANTDIALGATWKAGKTLLSLDMAVSLAAGVPFLGEFAVPKPVRVAYMINEGGRKRAYQYIAAIAEHKGLDVRRDVLPRLFVQHGASKVTDPDALAKMAAQLGPVEPAIIFIDPWYLSAGETDSKDLNSAGGPLGNLSGLARGLGASLLITNHWRKGGTGEHAERWTGVGLQAWARVLIDMDAKTTGPLARTADRTGKTTTTAVLELRGVLNATYRVEREVWSDDRDDLDSAMHYSTTAREIDPMAGEVRPLTDAEKRKIDEEAKSDMVMFRVLAYLRTNAAEPPTMNMILQRKIGDGSGSKTTRTAALELAAESGWITHAGEASTLRGGKFVDADDKQDDTKIIGKSRLALTTDGQAECRRLEENLSKVDRFTGEPVGPLVRLRPLG